MNRNINSDQNKTAQSYQTPAWFGEFIKFLGRPKRQVTPEVKKIGEQLLNQSRLDLQEFREKYDAHDYARSIFWLQQATEKATKGFLLLLGVLGKEELQRKIGHITPIAFLQSIESKELRWFPGWLESLKNIPSLQNAPLTFDVDEVRSTLRKERHSLATLNVNQVDALIQLYHSLETTLQLTTINWSISTGSWPDKKDWKLVARGDTKQISEFAVSLIRLYIIGLITFPHWDTTRYPGENISPINYTTELGVVAKADKLANMLATSIQELDSHIIENKPRSQ